jgi:DNA-binding MarR family transcriptional regulator
MLTDKAKELEKDYNDISNKMSNTFYKNFSDKEINEIENYLERIISNLEE